MGKKTKKTDFILTQDPKVQWKFGELLGSGTFGSVFKAYNDQNVVSAAKVVPIENEYEFEDIKQEADILLSTNHQYILKAFACFFWNRAVTIVLEICHGGSLDSICQKMEGFNENTTRMIMYQAAVGLAYLHSKNIIHRDIKLGNIMMSEFGICKIADFGVSAVCSSSKGRRKSCIGTPYWMAPEVIACDHNPTRDYDFKCDIYSLGITAYECTKVYPPNWESDPTSVLMTRLMSPSPTFGEKEPISKDLSDFVNTCLSKFPDGRPKATDLLKLKFLSQDKLKSGDGLLMQLYKFSKAPVEEIYIDELEENGKDHQGDTGGSSDRSSTNSIPSDFEKTKASLRTIKKTIRINHDGVEMTKTIIKNVSTDALEKDKGFEDFRQKVGGQMKMRRLQESRELKKLEEAQEAQYKELVSKLKTEYDDAFNKYRAETENLTKTAAKDIEKKRLALREEVESAISKIKKGVQKELKNHKSALKSKKKEKYDQKYLDPDFSENIKKLNIEDIKKIVSEKNTDFTTHCVFVVQQKNNILIDEVRRLIVIKLNNLRHTSFMNRSHICCQLDFVLNQRIKSDLKELSISLNFMQEALRNREKECAKALNDLPKAQKIEMNKILSDYKKSLQKAKSRIEGDLLKKRQKELQKRFNEETEEFKESQTNELKKMVADLEQQLQKVMEYQDMRKQTVNLSYQELIFKRSQETEAMLKEELFTIQKFLAQINEGFQSELNSYQDSHIDYNISDTLFD